MVQQFVNKYFYYLFFFTYIFSIVFHDIIGFGGIDEICGFILLLLFFYNMFNYKEWPINKAFLLTLFLFLVPVPVLCWLFHLDRQQHEKGDRDRPHYPAEALPGFFLHIPIAATIRQESKEPPERDSLGDLDTAGSIGYSGIRQRQYLVERDGTSLLFCRGGCGFFTDLPLL